MFPVDKKPFDFGARLQELRKNKKLTQKEVANKIGINKNTISKYENNTGTPSLERLVDLAILYNSSLDYIVNLSSRESIYLDDLSEKNQVVIKNMIEMLKNSEAE